MQYNAKQCNTMHDDRVAEQVAMQGMLDVTVTATPASPLYHSSTNLVHFSFAHLLIVKFVKDIPLEHWEILNRQIFDIL